MRKLIISFVCALVVLSACEKVVLKDPSTDPVVITDDKTPPTITASDPANNATAVAFNHPIVVTFSKKMDSTTITASTFTLTQGTTLVNGTVSYSGTSATFVASSNLDPSKIYTATITTGAKDLAGNALGSNYTFSFTSAAAADITPPVVNSTDPLNNATGVALSKSVAVTFSESMNATTITSSTFTLKQGSTAISGTVSYSGTQATFTPSGNLDPSKVYTGTITTGATDLAGNALSNAYTFNFTTGSAPDITPPTIISTDPINNATGVASSKAVAVTFSEALTSSTINTSTFTLKQGSTTISGSVSYSGIIATFTPTSSLAPSSVFTGTITTGAKDVAGNALSSNYIFSFTTAAAPDITAPTVSSTDPTTSATGVATNKVIGITFSEAMTPSTISTSTFTLNQGSTAVSGTVAYSGTTATFTPSAVLIAGTVYTATMTTGAKDLAGNALAANKVWTFTTAGTAPAPGLSFANDVVPVLGMCESCHTHGWTPSSNASTYYTNLVSKGYVNASSYTTSTIYTKLQSGHPGTGSISKANTDKIINWMIQGSLNN